MKKNNENTLDKTTYTIFKNLDRLVNKIKVLGRCYSINTSFHDNFIDDSDDNLNDKMYKVCGKKKD